ncbi:hypothetical protein Tco_0529042 [Tanacetum coccineum]
MVHSAHPFVKDVYLLVVVDIMSWALVQQAIIPLPILEVPGVDGSWGESVHPSLCGSSKSEWEDTQHNSIPRNFGNIESTYDVEDSINMIVGILVLVPREGVFPPFSHELTLDFEANIAFDFWFNHTRCVVSS